MFGLVPKPIWSRLIPADESNAIPQNANCLLIELQDGRKGLVDTGCGNPAWFSEKQRRIHDLDDSWLLMEALHANHLVPEEIDFVVLTHMHWDHVGGIGRMSEDGSPSLTFPNAQHFVHTAEWRDAVAKDPLLGNSYLEDTFAALKATQHTNLILVTDAAPDILPGVRMARSSGHTYGHCVVVLSDDQLRLNHPDVHTLGRTDTLIFVGDACPTSSHLRLVFQTAYDTFPLDTRKWKRETFPEISKEGYVIMFGHDPMLFGATIQPDPKQEFVVQTGLRVQS